jgi:transporter family protein
MWWIYALLSAFFAALTAVFAKVGIKNINPDLATAIRTVIILILAWAIVFARGSFSSINALSKTTWIFLGLSGISTGLSWVFYFRALQAGKVSQVAAIDKLSLALAIILSIVFLGETLNLKMAIGSLLILAGTVILIL